MTETVRFTKEELNRIDKHAEAMGATKASQLAADTRSLVRALASAYANLDVADARIAELEEALRLQDNVMAMAVRVGQEQVDTIASLKEKVVGLSRALRVIEVAVSEKSATRDGLLNVVAVEVFGCELTEALPAEEDKHDGR